MCSIEGTSLTLQNRIILLLPVFKGFGKIDTNLGTGLQSWHAKTRPNDLRHYFS